MNALNKIAQAVGYAVLSAAALGFLVLFADDIIAWVLSIGLAIFIWPISIFLSLLGAAIAGTAIALPARPFMSRERWDNLAAWIGLAVWILIGTFLTMSG